MEVKIILHGKLSKLYGKEFYFSNIAKAKDAVYALETKFPGFRKYIVDQAREGLNYEIIVDNKTETAFSMNDTKNIKVVEIAPSIIGKDPVTLGLILGGGLAVAGYYIGITTLVGGILFAIGIGIIIAGINYLMTPIPEREPDEASNRAGVKNSSFLFNSPQNVSTQGRPVPIAYGRLRVGSYVVGTTLSNYNLSQDRQNVAYENIKSNALVKIHNTFGSSVSNHIRGY
jgi:predicted phage tail protein